MYSETNFPEALSLIEQELSQTMVHNIKKYGQAYPTASQGGFRFSEVNTENKTHLPSPTLESEGQLSLMYHECLVLDSSGYYLVRAMHLNTLGEKHSCAYHYFEESETSATHKHEFIELIYVYSGHLTEIIEDEKHVLQEHQVCFLNRNCEHRDLRSESEGIAFYLDVRPGYFTEYMMKNIRASKLKQFMQNSIRRKQNSSYLCLSLGPEESRYTESCIGEMLHELIQCDDCYIQVCRLLLVRMLNAMAKAEDAQLTSVTASSRDKLMYQVLMDFIDENLDTVDLEMLCQQFHYQKDYYNRLIRKHTGQTFSAYLQKLRLERAKDMLTSSNLPASSISMLVGYKNPTYFFRIFKEETGKTPHEFRNR